MSNKQVELFNGKVVAQAVCTSGKTLKGPDWHIFDGMPKDSKEVAAYMDVIRQVIFAKYIERKKILNAKGFPAQPIYLRDIFEGVISRVNDLRSCGDFPFPLHDKRWVDRRVNDCAVPKWSDNGIPKVICATAGFYQPNPMMFDDSMIFDGEMGKVTAMKQIEAYWENERRKK
jgi:hypothetical protein